MTHAKSNVVPLRSELEVPPITSLSFVKDYWVREPGKRQGHSFRVFWDVNPSGDYGADCIAGEHMALEWLRYTRSCQENSSFASSGMLSWFASDMPPESTGLEVGFWSIIGGAADAGAEYGEAFVQHYERFRAEGGMRS
jgi:hypothetical protein